MDYGLKGHSVLVAAASEGIARAAAEKFAGEGARLALCSRDATKLSRTADAIRQRFPSEVLAETCDVTDEAAVRRFVDRVISEYGSVDVCVPNAGGPPARQFLATTSEEWQRAVELNFLSVVHLAHAVLPSMQQRRWGRIVTITSVSVRQPVDDLVYSNAVRAGVVGLVKSLSNEFGRDGITVNNVAPGFTATARLKELIAGRAKASAQTEQQYEEQLSRSVPLARLGQPEEVADAIVWLASERASYITGQTLLVDGGAYRGL